MSNPGLTTTQLTPELLQQLQLQTDNQRRMAMAQNLMGNNADPKTPYAGLANVGNDVLGAYQAKNIMAQNDPLNPVKVTPKVGSGWGLGTLGGLFGIGGGS